MSETKMNQISFMSANFVARQLGYRMTQGWMEGDRATNAYFKPLETFQQRFEEMLLEIRAMGFDSLDVWTAHLNWSWATHEHLDIATELLRKHNLQVASLAGYFGGTRAEFESACKIAVGLGAPILGGGTNLLPNDTGFVVETLKKHNLKLGLENHPEKTPEELLKRIGNGSQGTIGAAVDTGWFGTQGYDAAVAIGKLAPHVFHVHLKDVLKPGAHETCCFGKGCVPVEKCVRTLQQIDYRGDISVEHEPERFDPTGDAKASLKMLRGWLSEP